MLLILSRWALSNWKPLLLVVLVLAAVGTVYFKGRADGAAKVQLAWDEETVAEAAALEAKKEEVRKFVDQQARQYEGRIAKLNKLADALNQKLEDELGKNTVYRTCVLPPDGVQLLRDAAHP